MDHRLLLLTALLRGTLSPGDVASALGASDKADALLEGLEPAQRKALETDLSRRTGSPTSQGRSLLAELGRQNLLDNSLTAHLPDDWQTAEADMTIDREPSEADMTIDREPADPDVTIGPGEHHRVLLEPASDRQQDPHSITRFLAEGGLGQVFVAQDTRLGREVVLKQLQQVDNDESMGRFMREAQVTGQLEHPNIVPIYGLGWDKNDAPYYTMKYVRGRTLADLVEDYHRQKQEGSASRLQLRELLDAFLSVCNAVGYSHTREVVHRDLKPENIAVGEFGEVIVLDWGLAKLLEEPDESTGNAPLGTLQDAGQTIQGRVMGTPNYMPPEQARGEIDSIDTRADIYSLGAILFHILAGSPPRQKNPENLEQLIAQVAAGQIPTLRERDRSTPRELDAICSHAMNTDPADRYQTVAALSDDLKHWLVDEPVSVCPDPWPKKAARWARNHKAAVTTAASVAMIAVFLLASATIFLSAANLRTQAQIDEATREQENYEKQRVLAEKNARTAITAEERAESAEQVAQEQRDLARRSEAEAASQRDIARQGALESRRQLIQQHITRGMALAGEQRSFEALLWFTRAYEQDSELQRQLHPGQTPAQQQARLEEHQLRIHNVLSRCPLPVQIWRPKGGAGQVRFSPTGTVLASCNGHPASPATGAGQARLWDALSGQPLSPPLEHDQSVNQLLFHHDGTLLATAAGGPQGAGSARVWQVPSGAPAGPPIPSAARIVKVALHPGGTLLATASADGSARVWQIDSGTAASEVMVHDAPLVDIAFSPDGQHLVTAAANQVRIWDATTGTPMGDPASHPGKLGLCCFSGDGTRVITAIESGFFFQLGPGELPLRPALGSGDASFRLPVLRVSPGESMSLAGGRDGRYMISRPDRKQVPRGWSFDQAISDGHFTRQGNAILLSSYSGDVALMDSENGQLESPPLSHPAAVFSASMSSDNRYIATGSRDGNIRVWDTALAGREGEDFPQPFTLYGASYAEDGRHFVLATAEHNVVAWRRQAPILPAFSLDHQAQIGLVTYGPGNNRIVTATIKGSVHLWNATDGDSIADLIVDDKPSTKVIFSPDGGQIATTTTDRYLHLWNATNGIHLQAIGPFPSPVLEVVFHPATPLVSVVTREPSDPTTSLIQQRDTLTGKAIGSPIPIDGQVRSLAAHPDGQQILLRVSTTIGDEDHAQFWNIHDRTAAPTIFRQQNPLHAAIMNSTGSLLLTSDLNGTARLWDSEGGTPISPPLRHGSPITDMAFSHHGRYFATATENGIVQLWSSASGTPLVPPIDVGSTIVGITFHPNDEELMILMNRAIRFIDLGGSGLSPAGAGILVSALRGHRLSDDGQRSTMTGEEALKEAKLLKTRFPDLFTLTDQQSFTWHQLHGPDVPAAFWTHRRDTITDHLAQATQDYVRYSLYLQRARSHVELENYQAALDDLSASHRHARPEFSRGSYSLPLFQRACLAAFLDRADIYTETFQAMINSVDPLNPVDAARMATAICLSASDHGPLPLSIQLAARSGPRNPTPQPYLALSLALYRSDRGAESRKLSERTLASQPGTTRLPTAIQLVSILAMVSEGAHAEATAQMAMLQERLTAQPSLSSGKLGDNWHERLIVEILRKEVDQALLAPPTTP